jgi:hypothetical protein
MSRNKSKPGEPERTNELQMVQVENVLKDVFIANYRDFQIKKYTFNLSPDRLQIMINAVIDTPFPTFDDESDIDD